MAEHTPYVIVVADCQEEASPLALLQVRATQEPRVDDLVPHQVTSAAGLEDQYFIVQVLSAEALPAAKVLFDAGLSASQISALMNDICEGHDWNTGNPQPRRARGDRLRDGTHQLAKN